MSNSSCDRGDSTELVHWSRSLSSLSVDGDCTAASGDTTLSPSSSSQPLPTKLSRLSGVAGVLSHEPWLRSAREWPLPAKDPDPFEEQE